MLLLPMALVSSSLRVTASSFIRSGPGVPFFCGKGSFPDARASGARELGKGVEHFTQAIQCEID